MHPAARDLSQESQPQTVDAEALQKLGYLLRTQPPKGIRVRRDLYDLRAKDGKTRPNWAPAGRNR